MRRGGGGGSVGTFRRSGTVAHSLPQPPTSGKQSEDTLELALSADSFSYQYLKMEKGKHEDKKRSTWRLYLLDVGRRLPEKMWVRLAF